MQVKCKSNEIKNNVVKAKTSNILIASHARGQRFESVRVHHIKTPIASESFAVWKRIGVFLFKEWISLAQRFYAGKV